MNLAAIRNRPAAIAAQAGTGEALAGLEELNLAPETLALVPTLLGGMGARRDEVLGHLETATSPARLQAQPRAGGPRRIAIDPCQALLPPASHRSHPNIIPFFRARSGGPFSFSTNRMVRAPPATLAART
jgi:hypothetical protein